MQRLLPSVVGKPLTGTIENLMQDFLDTILGKTGGTIAIFIVSLTIIQIILNESALKANKIKFTVDFLNEWREKEFKDSQRFVLTTIKEKLLNDKCFVHKGFSNLEGDEKEHVLAVSYFLDYLGNLLAAGALHEKLLLTMLAQPIINHWETLRPLLYQERKMRNPMLTKDNTLYKENYQGGFENLYIRAKEFKKEEMLKGMKLDPKMEGKDPPPMRK